MKFTIPGPPVGKGRPRATIRGGKTCKGYVGMYTDTKTIRYENDVRNSFHQQIGTSFIPMQGCIALTITAYFPILKSTPKKYIPNMLTGILKPDKKPDIDNIAKIITDGLNNVLYIDDKQITSLTVKKRYSDNPRVEVEFGLDEEVTERPVPN